MRMIEWAFAQDVPHSEKLVLVYLACTASAQGVGIMNRAQLMTATGYKPRSIQRLLKSLRGGDLLIDIGRDWYRIGSLADPNYPHANVFNDLGELPDDVPPLGAAIGHASADGLEIHVDTEQIAQTVGDYVIDQLGGFEARMDQRLDAFAMFHVEQEIEVKPDPVIENPLYEQLIDSGMVRPRAYALSQADLDMTDELDNETPAVEALSNGEYSDDVAGRYVRILDILHGSESDSFDMPPMRSGWIKIEAEENKHTVKGEPDAFLLVYPAIIEAAKASVGKLKIGDFCDPKRVKDCEAPWHRELSPVDKEDPAMAAEIGTMLAEIEAANDPNCQVGPRTTEKLDGGGEIQETLLGFHRRVKAKHNQMLQLRAMGIV